MSLLECNTFTPLGIHMCQHSQDVGVNCEGMWYCFVNVYCIGSPCIQPPLTASNLYILLDPTTKAWGEQFIL